MCTASTLLFHLTVFLIWVFSARSVPASAVLHWYTRYVSVQLSVRHSAAVDLERSGSDEKTWTTVPRTMRKKRKKGHDHQEQARDLLRIELGSMVAVDTHCENDCVTAGQANSRIKNSWKDKRLY